MFICPNCGQKVKRLIGFKNGVKCPNCSITCIRDTFTDAHIKYGGGLTGLARKNLTIADVKHITNRTLSPDGKRVVYKDSRWR